MKPSSIALGEVGGADDVGAGLLGLAGLVALGEDGDADVAAGAVREHERAAELLVGVADVEPEAEVHLDRLVELRELAIALSMRIASTGEYVFSRSICAARVDVASCRAAPLQVHLHAHRARRARDDQRGLVDVARVQILELRLGDLSAPGRCESRPTLSRFGSAEPFSSRSASLIRTAAGGVFVMNVNERSSKTVISTGVIRPFCRAVCALNALQNSMMLTPCWPSAGPTGGAGLACPPGIWSLMSRQNFLCHLKSL